MDKYTTKDFDREFPDNDACLDYLFRSRWLEGVTCQKCQKVTGHHRVKGRPCYECQNCGSQVYPMAGSIFEGTRFNNLRLWFKAVEYLAVTRCGISSRQLSRDLGVGVKTGWRMFTQIRKVLNEDGTILQGSIEMDETYIGGKAKNLHANKRDGKRGRPGPGSSKTTVFGMVERQGRVKASVVPDTTRATLLPKILGSVNRQSMIYTDEFSVYDVLHTMGYGHGRVNHSAGVYVEWDAHTNTIEGFWSQLKRSIDGTYEVDPIIRTEQGLC